MHTQDFRVEGVHRGVSGIPKGAEVEGLVGQKSPGGIQGKGPAGGEARCEIGVQFLTFSR